VRPSRSGTRISERLQPRSPADRLRHLARLAGAVTDAAALVADDDDRREGEAPAALTTFATRLMVTSLSVRFVVLVAVASPIARGTAGTAG